MFFLKKYLKENLNGTRDPTPLMAKVMNNFHFFSTFLTWCDSATPHSNKGSLSLSVSYYCGKWSNSSSYQWLWPRGQMGNFPIKAFKPEMAAIADCYIFKRKYHQRWRGGSTAHCAGRHFRTKLMSQYIGSGQNIRFDVRIRELVSKVQDLGPFWRKNVFYSLFLGFSDFRLVVWPFLLQSLWNCGSRLKLNFMTTLFYKKNHFELPFPR